MDNQKQMPEQKQPQEKSRGPGQYIWLILALAAVLLFWLLSSLVYK